MKKFWYAKKVALSAIPFVLLLLFLMTYGDGPAQSNILAVVLCLAALPLCIAIICRPLGLWMLCQVDEANAHQQHLLTRRTRTMPLAAPYTYRMEKNGNPAFLVLSEQAVTTVKEARSLARRGQAMFLPLEGFLRGELAARAKAAERLYDVPQTPGKQYWPCTQRMLLVAVFFLYQVILQAALIHAFGPRMINLVLLGIVLALCCILLWLPVIPLTPFHVFHVSEGRLYVRNLLTRREQSLPLDGVHPAYAWQRTYCLWIVITKPQDAPIATEKETRSLYRTGNALYAPVAGPMEAALTEYLRQQRAPELK